MKLQNRSPHLNVRILLAVLITSGGAVSSTALATQKPHPMPQSVWVEVTPSGQQLVDESLLTVIEGSGLSLRSHVIPSLTYKADTPITLDQLSLDATEAEMSAFTRLRDEIRRWLMGVQIQDPLIQAEINTLAYEADFERFSLRIIGRDSTREKLRVRLEIVLPEFSLRVDKILARDLNNDWLGSFGLQKVLARIGSKERPTQIFGEFEITARALGKLDLSVLSFQTNIGSVPSHLNFSPDLIFPKVEIVVNGQTMRLNPTPIADLIHQQKDTLTQSLQKYLETMIQENLPKWAAQASSKVSRTDLSSALPLSVPPELAKQIGAQPGKFLLGFYPDRIGIDQLGSIRLSTTTFLENALSLPNARTPMIPAIATSPAFSAKVPHDFALGVHTHAINRALSLAHESGLFSNIKLDDKSSIALFVAPKLELDRSVPSGLIRVQLAIQKASGGWLERLFINKDIKLTFTGYLKVIRNPDSSFSLALSTVEPDTLKVDHQSATLPVFHPLIRAKVHQLLTTFKDRLKTEPLMLAAKLRPLEEMSGLKWRLVKMDTEASTGFITAYFEFIR